jgi:hypothetical protein
VICTGQASQEYRAVYHFVFFIASPPDIYVRQFMYHLIEEVVEAAARDDAEADVGGARSGVA